MFIECNGPQTFQRVKIRIPAFSISVQTVEGGKGRRMIIFFGNQTKKVTNDSVITLKIAFIYIYMIYIRHTYTTFTFVEHPVSGSSDHCFYRPTTGILHTILHYLFQTNFNSYHLIYLSIRKQLACGGQ